MDNFFVYFQVGFYHILDINGFDHILFILALIAQSRINHWKQLLALITAFTIGHSITLALSVFDVIKPDASLIELLIPITIFITAIYHLVLKQKTKIVSFIMTLCFGLIHGMGFSNYLKSLLGKNSNVIFELFSFNIGLEAGQIIFILTSLALFFMIDSVSKKTFEWRGKIILSITALLSIYLFVNLLNS